MYLVIFILKKKKLSEDRWNIIILDDNSEEVQRSTEINESELRS